LKRLRLYLANVARSILMYRQFPPPLGILSLASFLRSRFDLDIRVVNQRAERCSSEEVAKRAIEFGADIVGLGCLTPSGHEMPHLTQWVREGLPSVLIVLGGPHVTASGAASMEATFADAAVPGEGELSLEAIVRAWFEGDGDLSGIPGIFWRSKDGEIITNPGTTAVVEDLDSLPLPAYDLIDLRLYWKSLSFTPIAFRRYLSVMTSRGCPFHCNYCQHVLGTRWRAYSAPRIVEEIKHCVDAYGVDTIEVLDDVFNLDTERVFAFSELAVRENLKVNLTFPNGVRSDIMTPEVIDALVSAGMDQCTFALESGSPRIQKAMGKRLNIARYPERGMGRGSRRLHARVQHAWIPYRDPGGRPSNHFHCLKFRPSHGQFLHGHAISEHRFVPRRSTCGAREIGGSGLPRHGVHQPAREPLGYAG